jgi:hypothetical protein
MDEFQATSLDKFHTDYIDHFNRMSESYGKIIAERKRNEQRRQNENLAKIFVDAPNMETVLELHELF